MRRDVLFTETPGGVLFHNADGGFHLTGRTAYRFAALVVPHLTGGHRLEEICAGFGPAQREMAAGLVGTLYERGFARDIPEPAPAESEQAGAVARRFAAQIAYVDHYVDGAAERFGRFRDTRVAVLGTDAVARWCVLSLVRNGCAHIATPTVFPDACDEAVVLTSSGCPVRLETVPMEADWEALAAYDVVVVTGAGAEARTHRLLAAGVPEGQTLIPAWTFGNRAVTGPLSTKDSTGCWSCAVLRLGGNTDAGTAAEIWSRVADGALDPGAADGPVAGPVAAMAGNLVGYEVFRIATGALPAETRGQLLIQDLDSLDVMAEPVLPHPRCLRCAALDAERPAAVPAGLALPATPTVETAREAEGVVDELNRISTALVRPFTGVFARYDDESLTQTPLKLSRVEVALAAGRRRTVAAFDVHHLAGARTRALYAAAEAYAARVVPVRGAEPGLAAVLPARLAIHGGTGAGEAEIAAWTPAVSLLSKGLVRVPAAAAAPFGAHNRDRHVLATGAGTGSGATAEEAAGRGLLSALAHDALLRALRGGGTVGRVAVADSADPELVFLLKSAANLGVGVEVLDLGEAEHTTAHVVLAREAGGERWAVGAELSRGAAVCAALRDLLGQVQLAAEDPAGDVDPGDPLMGDLAPGTVAVTGEQVAVDAPGTAFETVLTRLWETGRDALHVATTPADLESGGIHTARVLLTTGAGTGTGGGSGARG